MPSNLQHQAQCIQAIHKTIQQFHQQLKVEQLDWRILQPIVVQPRNDFALLRYLLFCSIGTTPINDTSFTNSTLSPATNPNPTSAALPIPCTDEPPVSRSDLEGAAVSPRAKTNNFANAKFQSSPNTREAPPTTVQKLTSRISKLEKLFAVEIPTYTSITAGIHSQYLFLPDKIRQLEAGNLDAIIWKIPSVKFVFNSAKVARQSSDPLNEPATSFSSQLCRTHPHGYNFFVKFYPYGIGPATGKCESVLVTLFPGDYDKVVQSSF